MTEDLLGIICPSQKPLSISFKPEPLDISQKIPFNSCYRRGPRGCAGRNALPMLEARLCADTIGVDKAFPEQTKKKNKVFDRPVLPPSVCPPSLFTSISQDEYMQTLEWPIPPVGYTLDPASVTFISIPSSSTILTCHSMEADAATLSLSPPELLDEVMVDLEDIMDVDEVYGGTERSGIAGEGDEEMSATLEDVVLDIKSGDDADHDRMIVDAGQSSVFDVFVEYFASVMRPGSWMDIDLSGCRLQ
ncbi:hypothetical protein EV360DRAFT_76118 [Lentinula raphanica]|nr:hypothetical protein EV360DRAFT_76118 [Lentinula raphanica]